MLDGRRSLSFLLPATAIALALLAWVFGFVAFFSRLGDPVVSEPEQFHRAVATQLVVSHAFTLLAALALVGSVWLSGYTVRFAKLRAIAAVGICLALVGFIVWFVVENELW